MRHANLKVTMDTYVQAVTDEKREAQNKVVKLLLSRYSQGCDLVNRPFWTRGEIVMSCK